MSKRQHLLVAAATVLASSVPTWAADFQVGSSTTLSLSGLIAVGVKDSQVSNNNATDTAKHAAELRVDDNTSRVIISGATEFTPGWKAIFRIESRFTAPTAPSDALMPGLPSQISQQYTAGTATGWADGDTWVGLQCSAGTLVFGKAALYYLDGLNMSYFGVNGAGEGYRAWDGNGLGVFNMLSQVGTSVMLPGLKNVGLPLATLGITRSQNVIRFDSAKFNGFDVALAYTKNPDGQENTTSAPQYGRDYADGGTTYARVRYNNGEFTASASALNKVVQGGNNNSLQAVFLNDLFSNATGGALPQIVQGPMDTHAYRLTAGYKLPMGLKFGVVYDSTAVDNGVIGTKLTAKRSVVEVPLTYAWGDHAVYATYNKAGNTSNIANSGATQVTVGYDYAFTKRIFGGVFFTQLNNASQGNYQPFLAGTVLGGSAPGTGENWHQISVDINYWF